MNNKAKISSNAVNPQIWIEEYRESLFNYALARLQDADLAEESLQEAFLAALQSRERFQGLASEKTWLISILKRKIYDYYRRIGRDRQFKMKFPIECLRNDVVDYGRTPVARSRIWFSDPSIVYEQKEFLKIIQHALSELPDRTAQAFILREVIDISVCNLYVMVHRARKHLKDDLQLKWLH